MKVVYQHFENVKLQKHVASLVSRWLPFLPKSLERLWVSSCLNTDGDTSMVAMVNVSEQEYQQTELSLFTRFYDMAEDEQIATIAHEFVHIHHSELLEYVRRQLIEPIRERNPELYDHADREFRERVERFTQNITFAILRMMASGNKE